MNPFAFFPYSLLFLTLILLNSKSISHSDYDEDDDRFSRCAPFDCGKIKGISYPFRENQQPDYCGRQEFVLDCQTDHDRLVFDVMSQRFRVLEIDHEDRTLEIVSMDFWDSVCPEKVSNITLNSTLFKYTKKDQIATLFYDCDPPVIPNTFVSFSCPVNNISRSAYLVPGTDYFGSHLFPWPLCNVSVVVPVMEKAIRKFLSNGLVDVGEILREGFEIGWSSMDEDKCGVCSGSGGRCGFNVTQNEFRCFCPDRKAYAWSCGGPTFVLVPPATDHVDPAEVSDADNSPSTYFSS